MSCPKIVQREKTRIPLPLDSVREKSADQFLTINRGLRVNDDQNSFKAGACGSGDLARDARGHASPS